MLTVRDDAIKNVEFSQINLDDPFFDSLKSSYNGFDDWVYRKAAANESTLMSFNDDGSISSMLYLKPEDGVDRDTNPPLRGKRLKIGTFKVDFAHHTSIGNRLLGIALRNFVEGGYEYAYLTMFDTSNTQPLKRRIKQYGFQHSGFKGEEEVWTKSRPDDAQTDPHTIFPFIRPDSGQDWLLSIRPEYHVKMFGEVNLQSEYGIPVEDSTSINTIEKIYLSAASNATELAPGDHLLFYRTSDGQAPAAYRSVVSGIGTVTDIKDIHDFNDEREFGRYVKGKSVFTATELRNFWRYRKFPYLISFLYNTPFKRYPIRKNLLDTGLIPEGRIICEPLDKLTFNRIIQWGEINEGYVINQA